MQRRMDTPTMEPAENPMRQLTLTPTIIPSSTPMENSPATPSVRRTWTPLLEFLGSPLSMSL